MSISTACKQYAIDLPFFHKIITITKTELSSGLGLLPKHRHEIYIVIVHIAFIVIIKSKWLKRIWNRIFLSFFSMFCVANISFK